MSELIKGSGGGGKGGGSARVAVEAPDSLRSKQFARVIDLVSEGEIQGLVNGMQSVFLNDTPVQNPNGSFNFQGVAFDSRRGTQAQTHIAGFPSVESEIAVSVEVTAAASVTRTITNSTANDARVTLSVPRLTSQNTSTGDLSGTSVRVAIDVQSDGGGFVAAKLSTAPFALSVVSGIASSLTREMVSASLDVAWSGTAATTYQTASYRVDYRVVGAGTWIALSTGSFSGTATNKRVKITNTEPFLWNSFYYINAAPTDSRVVSFTAPADAAYEFQVTLLSGTGTLAISGSADAWLEYDTISGKTSSRYQRSYKIPLAGSAPWDIRVRRLTADSTSQALQNQTFFDSYTELVDQKFVYPNSALMALSINAERFNNIPTRGYEIEGMILQVPSNYDALTREYDGAWNGTFITAYSNNPAWCFYDMITNDRYGLGKFIDVSLVDKWALYEIAQYCDVLIDDGLGGKEPRFTFNTYLQSRAEAYKVLESMASAFNAMSFWANGAITAVQDSPRDPIALFNSANVIGGTFNYSGSSAKTRHTVALVTWNDPADRYRQAIEYVADEAGISRYGVIQTEIIAVGCTSRGQANRFGRALLFSERMETETVTFKAGLDSASIAPGEVIQTSDPIRAGKRMGGRLLSATTTDFTLDSDITIDGVSVYTLWLTMPDGTVESQTVSTGASTTSALTVASAFSATPENYSIWVLGASNLVPETWRVISIAESDDVNADITALEYRSDKYLAIEEDLLLEPRQVSSLSLVPEVPTSFTADESLYLISKAIVGTRITASWEGSEQYYELQWRVKDGNWSTISTISGSVDIQPVVAGEYELKITAVNAIGVRSEEASLALIVYGLTKLPANVSGFDLSAITGNAHLTWDASVDLDVLVGGKMKIRHSSDLVSPTWSSSVDVGGIIAGSSTTATLPLIAGSYLAKWIDSSGNQSADETIISTTAPNILSMNFVSSATENPSFAGTKTDTGIDNSGNLILDSKETIDEQTILMDTWPRLSALGGIAETGTYLFSNSVDLGSVQTSRITADLLSVGFDALDLIDERGLVSGWESVDGDLIDDVDVTIYTRTSDDAITYSAWEKFMVGDYTSRAFEFKVVLSGNGDTHNIAVTDLSVTVDMPDKILSGEDLTSSGVTNVDYSEPFMVIPALGITAQDMETGDFYEITNKTTDDFDIIFKNSTGAGIVRTFDYIARAY